MNSEPTVQELFDLTGRTALITGASGYLGRSLASALAEAGANVIVSSREEAKAKAVADCLPVIGSARHHGLSLDQLDQANLADRFAAAAVLTGSIDVLVNN